MLSVLQHCFLGTHSSDIIRQFMVSLRLSMTESVYYLRGIRKILKHLLVEYHPLQVPFLSSLKDKTATMANRGNGCSACSRRI